MANIALKNAEKFGFKSISPLISAKPNRMYFIDTKNNKIWLIDNVDEIFYSASLSKKQMKDFNSDKWCIVPPGCNSMGKRKEIQVDWEVKLDKGNFTWRKIKNILVKEDINSIEEEEEVFHPNKQPFYHNCYLQGDEKKIIKAIKSIKSVLNYSVEYCGEELLFTATEPVAEEALKKLKAINGIVFESEEIDWEAGDPSDLM